MAFRKHIARIIYPKVFSENDNMKQELLCRGHVFFSEKKVLGVIGYVRGFVCRDGSDFKLKKIYLPNE